MNSARKRAWEEEYDRRLADPTVVKDVMANAGIFRPREVRVADDDGTMRRRNGEGCCGCGRWSNHHGGPADTISPDPAFNAKHSSSGHNHGTERKGFMDWLMS